MHQLPKTVACLSKVYLFHLMQELLHPIFLAVCLLGMSRLVCMSVSTRTWAQELFLRLRALLAFSDASVCHTLLQSVCPAPPVLALPPTGLTLRQVFTALVSIWDRRLSYRWCSLVSYLLPLPLCLSRGTSFSLCVVAPKGVS